IVLGLVVDKAEIAEGTSETFTIGITQTQTSPVRVRYSTTAGTAMAGRDFTPASGTVTIPANQNSTTVTLAAPNNNIHQGSVDNPQFTLMVSAEDVSAAQIDLDTTQTITVTDNDNEPEITLAGSGNVRPNGTATFTVSTGTIVSADALSVQVRITGDNIERVVIPSGNAADTANPYDIAVEIPAEGNQAEFSFTTMNAVEFANITVEVNGGITGTGYTLAGTSQSAQVEVRDISITFADATGLGVEVNEGETLENVLTLFPAQPVAITAFYATADFVSEAGVDYRRTTGSVRFAPGETTKTIRVPTINNNIDRGASDAAFTINANATVQGDLLTDSLDVTIRDDDESPVLAIAAPGRITPGRNGTVRIVSARTVSNRNQSIEVQVNGSFDYIYNSTHTINSTGGSSPIVVQQGAVNGSATFNVTLAAMSRQASFQVQASAGENVTPIVIAFASG
ncbi:MAG: hypothetical protein MJE68_29280, partial [Proteobacteria bacterium]|nr:hypothetical protein [Pseudomonadota bacterium]